MVLNERRQAAFTCLKNILAVQARHLQLHLNLHWILSLVFDIATELGVPVGLLSPIYTAENFWHGLDESGTRTKKIVRITHLHVLFSTVLNDVKL